MKVKDILAAIDSFAPFRLAEGWDNVGLMIGDPEWDVRRLGISLDPLPEALDEALQRGCQGLLSHHPLFFKPLRNVDLSSPEGRVIRKAVKADMAVIAAHTNWDGAERGVNRTLAGRIGLGPAASLVPTETGEGGLGAVGNLPAAVPVRELLGTMKRAWNLTRIDYYGDPACSILRVALCGGSGGSLWPAALAAGADLYVTADMKYHDILDCTRANLPVAAADHGEMESAATDELARCLAAGGGLETVPLGYRALGAPLRL
ncbi:MAG: Nif3-like dinuclear metal center hexameric protein [Synergistaceae bacterium]|jgi:dinuclear metal center YbgI/SA1388 family protein|nr:Nif3-like dinuclear metal center hexameric protein [Synergistaceae bacterium]